MSFLLSKVSDHLTYVWLEESFSAIMATISWPSLAQACETDGMKQKQYKCQKFNRVLLSLFHRACLKTPSWVMNTGFSSRPL